MHIGSSKWRERGDEAEFEAFTRENQYFVCRWIDMKYFPILVLIIRARIDLTGHGK